MRIRAFHVEQFGLLRDLAVENLPPGLSIFLGQNEAGKSTCLDFFRVMLTGYLDKRTAEGKERDYAAGGGGSLLLDTPQGQIRLTRRPGPGGGALTLHDAAGGTLDVGLLDRLMGGVTREVFRTVYGFSLNELQTLRSLNSRDVRNALYGASFGMGLRSPGAALKRLEDDMAALFKPGGSKQPLSAGLREWEDLRRQIRDVESEVGHYDELAGSLHTVERDLATLRQERVSQHLELRGLERRLGVWRQWEEWCLAGARLERMEPVAGTFPPDGLPRLERAFDRRIETERQGRLVRERLDLLRSELDGLPLDTDLLEAGEALRALAERKASCRNALAELPRLEAELRRAGTDLATQLALLGPGWTPERIRGVDRSLFVREEMERQAATMHVAETAYDSAMITMDKAVRGTDEARHCVELARRTLEALPVPVAEMGEPERDRLRKSLTRAEEAQQRLPERVRARDVAKADFTRALTQIQVRSGEAAVPTLEQLSASQDEAQALASTVLAGIQEATQARTLAEQAREAEKQARLRMARLQNEQELRGGPTRESIEARRQTLRRLRTLHGELAVAHNRDSEVQAGLEAHLAAMPRPVSSPALTWGGLLVAWCGLVVLLLRWQWGMEMLSLADVALPLTGTFGFLLLGLGGALAISGRTPEIRRKAVFGGGVLLVACGGGAIVARRLFDVTAVSMPSGIRVPLELWSGYLVLLAGICCLAWAMARKRPDDSPQRMVTEQWQVRCDDARARVQSLAADVAALCLEIGVVDAAPATLDELEARLDREREQWAANERMEQELLAHNRDIAELHGRTTELESDFAARNTQTQTAQRRWHDTMSRLGVRAVPAPESAQTFFIRVEQARRDWKAVQALEVELTAMETYGVNLMRLARELLPEKIQPEGWMSLGECMDGVRRMLDACREADLAAEERARATEAVRGVEVGLERAEAVQAEAVEALRVAVERLDVARLAWRTSLRGLGLDLELSPATTREALECMGRCLDLETDEIRLRGEQERQRHERDALILPVQASLERLKRPPRLDADGHPDWLASLDAALADVDDQRGRDETRRQIERTLTGQEAELRAVDEALADINRQIGDLLRLAEVADEEAFRHKDAVRAERDTLVRRREDLEDALRLAADDTPLDIFLDAFAALDRDQIERRLVELSALLETSACDEERLTDEAGTLRARLEQLKSSDLLTDLRVQEAALHESLHSLGQEWCRHALARHLLIEARRRFEKERQPEVIRAASGLLGQITNGQWVGVSASLEDSELRVLPAHGDPVPPEQLSRGTQEQLYLALRLAHIRHHAALAGPLPVIMDDILVNFDPERAARAASALVSLTNPELSCVPDVTGQIDPRCGPDGPGERGEPVERGEPGHSPSARPPASDALASGHQLLFFTCHPQIAGMLHAAAPDSVLLHVEHGHIRRVHERI